MPSPNLAFILVSEQWFTAYGLVCNLNFAKSADFSALNNAESKKFNNFFHIAQFYLNRPEYVWNYPTQIRPAFLPPNTTLIRMMSSQPHLHAPQSLHVISAGLQDVYTSEADRISELTMLSQYQLQTTA